MWWSLPWVWVVLGVAMALAEMVLPGFYLLGFAIGAVATGMLVWAGLIASLPMMLVALAVIAVAAWFALRRWAGVQRGQKRIWHRDINEN